MIKRMREQFVKQLKHSGNHFLDVMIRLAKAPPRRRLSIVIPMALLLVVAFVSAVLFIIPVWFLIGLATAGAVFVVSLVIEDILEDVRDALSE